MFIILFRFPTLSFLPSLSVSTFWEIERRAGVFFLRLSKHYLLRLHHQKLTVVSFLKGLEDRKSCADELQTHWLTDVVFITMRRLGSHYAQHNYNYQVNDSIYNYFAALNACCYFTLQKDSNLLRIA